MFRTRKSSIITLSVSLLVTIIACLTAVAGYGSYWFECLAPALLLVVGFVINPTQTILGLFMILGTIFTIRSIVAVVKAGKTPTKESKFTYNKLVWSIIFVLVCTFALVGCLLKPGTTYNTLKIESETVSEFEIKYYNEADFEGICVYKKYKDNTKSDMEYQKCYIKGETLYGYGCRHDVDENQKYTILNKYERHGLYAKCADADGEYVLINWYNCGMSFAFLILDVGAIVLLVQTIKSKKSSRLEEKPKN